MEALGGGMHEMMAELYPICRSITGDGFRKTMNTIANHIPLSMSEIPTGTKVFDWVVPKEWNIRDAYMKDADGCKIIDFKKSNLHVVSYSTPVHAKMPLAELQKHLHSLPEYPDRIPYKTSYYKENWGLCLTHNQFLGLKDGEYEVSIDSSLEDGHLTYAECFLEGERTDEILLSCHACHPSLCNDNLSGVVLATFLAKALAGMKRRYSYRILFVPGTIGAITWLSVNEKHVSKVKGGLVIACVGDSGRLCYKRSRQGNSVIDRSAIHVLKSISKDHEIIDFSPYGYDERQYCSPGFDLPVGSLTRTPYGRFSEYHTSADNLEFVRPEYLADSLSTYLSVVDVLENDRKYLNQNPKCEPQLGSRGLYRLTGGRQEGSLNEIALLWVLNQSDGSHSLLDIAERSEISFGLIRRAAENLRAQGLLQESS
jgi:aminopeptidase-like protein